MERRNFLRSVGLITAAAYIGPKVLAGDKGKFGLSSAKGTLPLEFPALPYAYDALEPYIDARTMEIHYDKHHSPKRNNRSLWHGHLAQLLYRYHHFWKQS